jgi:hypothetical protein
MICVMFMVKGNDEFNFIPTSSTEVLEVVNYEALFFNVFK